MAAVIVIGDDLEVFSSLEAAARYLEPPEVRAGLEVIDFDGRPVATSIGRRFLAEIVQLEAQEGAPAVSTRLRSLLIDFLAGREERPVQEFASTSDNELKDRALQFAVM